MGTYDPAVLAQDREFDSPIITFLDENAESIRKSISSRRFGPITIRGSNDNRLIVSLTGLLLEHPLFKESTRRFIGNHGFGTSPDQTTPIMLEVASILASRGAVDWLRRLISCTSTDVNVISVVSGMTVVGDIEFSNGCHLASPSAMNWSTKAQSIRDDPSDLSKFFKPSKWSNTDAFLWKRVTCRVLREGDQALYEPEKERSDQNEFLKAFSLHASAAPTSSTWWQEHAESDFVLATHGEGGHFGQRSDDGPEQSHAVSFSHSDAVLINNYLGLEGSWRNKCLIALAGLHLSRRIRSPSARSIQLCIALEALLGSDSNSEIAHRVSTRLSIILKDTFASRLQTKHMAKALYGMRSKAVHGMATDESKGWDIINEAAAAVLELCRKATTYNKEFPFDHVDLMGHVPAAEQSS